MRKLLFILLILFSSRAWSQSYAEKVAESKALIGQPVQAYTFYTLDRQPVTFETVKGEPVVAYFFASWCAPCYQTLSNLHQAMVSTRKPIRVIAISLDENWNDLDRMLSTTGFSGEVWKWGEAESALQQRLFANFSGSIPHIIRVDRQGILVEAGARIKTVEQWSAVIGEKASLTDASRL